MVQLLKDNWRCSKDWMNSAKSVTEFVFHSTLLQTPSLSFKICSVFEKCFLVWSEQRIGVINYVSKLLRDHVTQTGTLDPSFVSILIHISMFGPTRNDVDQRVQSMISYHSTDFTSTPPHFETLADFQLIQETQETAQWDFWCTDYAARVEINSILVHLDSTNPSHQSLALSMLDSILFDVFPNKQVYFKGSKFLNAPAQKRCTRLWCTVHCLLDFVSNHDDKALSYFKQIWTLLVLEKVPETMAFIEWTMMRLLIAHPFSLCDVFCEFFEQAREIAHCMASVLIISYHSIPKLSARPFEVCIKKALQTSLIWMAHKNFNVKFISQLVLIDFWNRLSTSPSSSSLELKKHLFYFESIVSDLLLSKDTLKTLEKCNDYVYLSRNFDPLSSLNLEFLFRGLFQVLACSQEERISCTAFYKVDPLPGRIPLGLDERHGIRLMVEQSKKPYAKEVCSVSCTSSVVDENAVKVSQGPVQRKIVPWGIFDF